MKNITVKITAALLSLVMLAGALCSCSTNSQTKADDGGKNKVSVAMYSLMTSLVKGSVAYYVTSKYGNYNSTDFWNTITDGETQMTYKEYYTYIVDEKVKTCLAALALFDELGLSLTKDEIDSVDEEMADFVKEDGNGSKNTLNGILAGYGADYRTLREYKLMNAKITKLSDYLYGSNASKVADNVKQKYLNDEYVAFRQILLPTYDYVYETDKYGDDIYYQTDSAGTIITAAGEDGKKYEVIAYDTVNGITIDGENGTDKNGNKIYFVAKTESLHIAYDKVGSIRKTVVDESGNEVIRDFGADKIQEVAAEADKVAELVGKINGDAKSFGDLIEIYDKNYGAEAEETVGEMFYLAKKKTYTGTATDGKMLDAIRDKVCEIEVGGYIKYRSDYGYHIIMRFEPEEGAFAESKNSGWFVDANKNYDFNTDIVDYLFLERLKPYIDKVKFNEKFSDSVDISTITPNYNFY